MFIHILNYTLRSAILIIGILIVSGVIIPPQKDDTFRYVLGSVVILFGLYRLIIYYTHTQRKYQNDDEDENQFQI